jgi:predicted alpha/beta hydrolase family esterase
MSSHVLILPGIGSSGPAHWQTLWEGDRSFYRVEPRDWEHPRCGEWVASLERAVARFGGDSVLVAHSLGCLLAVHWAAQSSRRVKAALLVAPPDPEAPAFPPSAEGFSPLPAIALPFPSLLAASRDDPFGSLEFARSAAAAWGSEFVDVGAAGHVNAASGLGAWPEGRALLRRLGA